MTWVSNSNLIKAIGKKMSQTMPLYIVCFINKSKKKKNQV